MSETENRIGIADRIARIRAIDFAGRPPASLEKVLGVFADLAGSHPVAELEKSIDAAVRNAKAMLAGVPGPTFPRHALELQEPPAKHKEEAA